MNIDYELLARLVAERLREFAAAPEVMTTERAAQYCGLSPKSLDLWRHDGDGPKFVKISNRVRYRKRDIDAWLAARVRANTLEDA
jgi:predicted DNA-binding transcriptional regulator AlpA